MIAAYAVFAVVLLWDFLAPRLQIRRELRAARLRKAARRPGPRHRSELEPMNPVRRRRLLWVLVLVVAAAIATTLVVLALQRNVAYLYTPVEVLRGETGERARFRLGGMVAEGSFQRTPGSLDVHFEVTDGDALLPVVYTASFPTCSARSRRWSPPAACRTAFSWPRRCWPSTTRPTCPRKSPTRWAPRTEA